MDFLNLLTLNSILLKDYLNDNHETLFDGSQYEMFETLKEIGPYTLKHELGSPFIGINWRAFISSRFGWRINPFVFSLDNHEAIDIALPGGTPINAVLSGNASVFNDPGGYGNYVVITASNGDSTLYAHMLSVEVSNGQDVKTGKVIGYVGSTGSSTGNHVHIEYKKNNTKLNPGFYMFFDE